MSGLPAFPCGLGLGDRSLLLAGHARKLQSVWPWGETLFSHAGLAEARSGLGQVARSTPSSSPRQGNGLSEECIGGSGGGGGGGCFSWPFSCIALIGYTWSSNFNPFLQNYFPIRSWLSAWDATNWSEFSALLVTNAKLTALSQRPTCLLFLFDLVVCVPFNVSVFCFVCFIFIFQLTHAQTYKERTLDFHVLSSLSYTLWPFFSHNMVWGRTGSRYRLQCLQPCLIPCPDPRLPRAWRATPLYANTSKPWMLESKTDKVYFFQSQWLVFHLQCHYSLTEQLCATLAKAPAGDAWPNCSASRWQLTRCPRCGRVVWYTCCKIHPIPLHFNFSNLELNFNNNF